MLVSCAAQKKLYRHSFRSPEQLANAVLVAIAKNDSLMFSKVLMTENEYKNIFYKSLPDSVKNAMPVDLAWNMVLMDSRKALKRYLNEFGGLNIKLKKVYFRFPPHRFEGFTVHRGMIMNVELPNGEEEHWRLLNVVLEQNGYYKCVTFND